MGAGGESRRALASLTSSAGAEAAASALFDAQALFEAYALCEEGGRGDLARACAALSRSEQLAELKIFRCGILPRRSLAFRPCLLGEKKKS